MYTFYADTPFHNLKTVAASYGILNAIVWWASKAVAEAYEQKRLRSVSTAFEANNSVWSAPLVDSEKPLRDSVSDYSLMDGNPSNADTYLSRPSNGRSVYSSSSRGDSVSLEDDFSTPSRPVSLASSSSPFQSGSYRNQLSPRLYGSPRR